MGTQVCFQAGASFHGALETEELMIHSKAPGEGGAVVNCLEWERNPDTKPP